MNAKRTLLTLAAGLIAAAPALAGTWTYTDVTSTSGTLNHSSSAWTLEVTRNEDDLAVVEGSSTGEPSALPLADAISGGLKITAIGDGAFNASSNMVAGALTIPNSVTNIGEDAFMSCTRLTKLTLGNSLATIGDGAFYGCDGLTGTLAIPNSVTSIGGEAFFNCFRLTGLTLGNNVTSIGDGAFSYCSKIAKLTLGASVTSIGVKAFYGCGLTVISVPAANTAYTGIDGVLFDKAAATLLIYPAMKKGAHYTVPGGVTHIGNNAFSLCNTLTCVTISDDVTHIGEEAFTYCYSLTDVIVGSGVTDIAKRAFYNCYSLAGVTFRGACPAVEEKASLYAYSTFVTSYIYNENVDSWTPQLDNGTFAGDMAIWCDLPIHIRQARTLGVATYGGVEFDNTIDPPVITVYGASQAGAINATENITNVTSGLKTTIKGLPSGMKYDAASGQIIGAPTKAGIYTITVTITGPNKASATQTFTMIVDALPDAAAGTFNGYLQDSDGRVSGTFTITAAKTGKITAKVVTPAGTQSFSAKSWDWIAGGVCEMFLTNKKASFLASVDTAAGTGELGVSGIFSSSVADCCTPASQYDAFGQRAELPAAAAYTVALSPDTATITVGTFNNAPLGDGYLTITVNAKGTANLAGLAADGATKLTASAPMLHIGSDWVIPAAFKVNSGKGYLGGLLTLAPDTTITGANWHWLNPGKTPGADDYSLNLLPFGSLYTPADAASYAGLTFKAIPPANPALWAGTWQNLPNVPITSKNGKLTLPPGKKLTRDGTFDPVNPALATLTLTAKSGIVKGKFTAYLFPNGAALKQTSASWAGVLLPAHACGTGSYLITRPENKKLKQSYPIVIE